MRMTFETRRALRRAGWLGVALFAVGLVAALMDFFLGTLLLMMIVFPAILLLWLAGGVVMSVRGARAARAMEAPRGVRIANMAAVPVAFLLIGVAAIPLLATGNHSGTFALLMANKSRYDAIAAGVRPGDPRCAKQGDQEQDGTTFMLECGRTVRIAFSPDGFLDTWSGIVHDPSGAVMRPEGGRELTPEAVTALFGGELSTCRLLWRPYYDCSFG